MSCCGGSTTPTPTRWSSATATARACPGLLHASRARAVSGWPTRSAPARRASSTLQPFLAGACQRAAGPAAAAAGAGDPVVRRSRRSGPRCGPGSTAMVLHESGPPDAAPHRLRGRARRAGARRRCWPAWTPTPSRFVAQEKVDFATTPMLRDGAVVPGHDRAAGARRDRAGRGDGPARRAGSGAGSQPSPSSPRASGLAKDVWVVDGRAGRSRAGRSRAEALMPQVDLRTSLPTRSAEALFWLGRHARAGRGAGPTGPGHRGARPSRTRACSTSDRRGLAWATAGLRSARVVGPAPAVPPDDLGPADAAPARGWRAELDEALVGPGGLAERLGPAAPDRPLRARVPVVDHLAGAGGPAGRPGDAGESVARTASSSRSARSPGWPWRARCGDRRGGCSTSAAGSSGRWCCSARSSRCWRPCRTRVTRRGPLRGGAHRPREPRGLPAPVPERRPGGRRARPDRRRRHQPAVAGLPAGPHGRARRTRCPVRATGRGSRRCWTVSAEPIGAGAPGTTCREPLRWSRPAGAASWPSISSCSRRAGRCWS